MTKCKATHWVSLFIDRNTVVYVHSCGIEDIPQEVLNKIEDKSTTHNIFRIQDNDSTVLNFNVLLSYNICLQKTLLDYTIYFL